MNKFRNNGLGIILSIIGLLIILCSSPIGYSTLNFVYRNKNLTGEYVSLLNGFIHSYMIIGTLIFAIGIYLNKKNEKS